MNVAEIVSRAALYVSLRDTVKRLLADNIAMQGMIDQLQNPPGRGEISPRTGRPRTIFVRAHWRSQAYDGYDD